MNLFLRSSRRSLHLLLIFCALIGPSLGLAHHSFAMFDSQNQIRVQGVVTQFDWTNPHVYIEVDVTQEDGSTKHWTIECANISILSRLGWKFNIMKAGDTITAVVAPLRNGQPGALLKQVMLADGSKWGNGAPAGPPSIDIETGEKLDVAQ
ncbi:MAG TPA: DUF6152 family protein [Pseudomonadales bacterium]